MTPTNMYVIGSCIALSKQQWTLNLHIIKDHLEMSYAQNEVTNYNNITPGIHTNLLLKAIDKVFHFKLTLSSPNEKPKEASVK